MTPFNLFLLIVSILLLLLLVLIYIFLIHEALMHHLYFKSQSISCAPFLPIFGHLPGLLRCEAEDRNLDFWKEHVTRFGSIHAISLANATAIKIDDPTYLKAVMRTQNACYIPSIISRMYLEKHLGEQNLLLLHGPEWSRHRRMINPAFHHSNLMEMVDQMVNETAKAIDRWLGKAREEGGVHTLDLHEEMTALTFSVIAACAFGAGFSALPNAPTSLHSTMRWVAEQTQWRTVHLVGILPVLKFLPLWGKPEMDRKKAEMFALVDAVVRDRKAGKTESLNQGKQDLLDRLLNARDERTGGALSEVEVRDEAMGHETTSSATCAAVYAMMTRADLWAACVAEVDSVCGDDPPAAEHLSRLPVLDAVFSEALRLYPPAPIISKDICQDHTITSDVPGKPDIHLKVGHHVHVDLHVINRLKEFWGPDANAFEHRRWLQGKKPFSHPYAYLPFSSGTRACIGQTFAGMESKVMLAMFVQKLRLEFVSGQKCDNAGFPVNTSVITSGPKYPMLVRVSDRRRHKTA